MDAKTPSNSEIINNIRSLSISRRGGVRTRGGRLPPINMRDLTTSNKKVISPNIPQRRRTIKTENGSSEPIVVKTEKPTTFENVRGRGKGRQQRVYLQTGGSFLAEGPAARLKRDPVHDDSFSSTRVSRRSAKVGSVKNIDCDAIKDIMDSYMPGEDFDDADDEGKPPVFFPLQKDKTKCKIKVEYDKIKIKQEVIEDFETGMKKEIKSEKVEDFTAAEDCIKETKYEKPSADIFLNPKDNGSLILLQLPATLNPLKTSDHENNKEKDKNLAKETEPKSPLKFFDNFEEGFIAKLKIMKSGRMKLTLGSVEFELLDGTSSETRKEVVSIKIGDGERDATVLGTVEKKLILKAAMDKLLTEKVEHG